MPIQVLVEVKVADGHRDEFYSLANADAEKSSGERGCLHFQVYEIKAKPGHYVFQEIYENQAGLDYHTTTEHYAAWGPFMDKGGMTLISKNILNSLFMYQSKL